MRSPENKKVRKILYCMIVFVILGSSYFLDDKVRRLINPPIFGGRKKKVEPG